MNEDMSVFEDKHSSENSLSKECSPGKLLLRARQSSGLHITELASSLKVSVEKIEALESDDFSFFSDVVFMRALAASVCRNLGVDSISVLELMPNVVKTRLPLDQQVVNTNFYFKYRKKYSLYFFILTYFSLIFLIFIVLNKKDGENFFPNSSFDYFEEYFYGDGGKKIADPISLGRKSNMNQSDLLVYQELQDNNENSSFISDLEKVRPESILFKARDSSWIQVKSIDGTVMLQRTLAPGELIEISENFPLSVIVGRADATDVLVRGLPFDLLSLSRENVARFEVK